MDFAAVFHIEARTCLDVGKIFRVGKIEAEIIADLDTVGFGRADQIDPEGLYPFKILGRFNGRLRQSPLGKFKSIDNAVGAEIAALCSQGIPGAVKDFMENFILQLIINRPPGKQQLFR